VLRAFGAAHQLGELEAVHHRHLHVEQRERDVVHEQELERLEARLGAEDLEPVAAQQRLERVEVLLDVVHEQKLHGLWGHDTSVVVPAGAPRCARMRPSSAGGSTPSTRVRAMAASGMARVAAESGACTSATPPAS
jgi:hypothetical protein